MSSHIRILSNIDLPEAVFADIADQYDRMTPVSSDLRFEDLRYSSLFDSDIPIELIGFFQRRCHMPADVARSVLNAIDRVFDTVRRAGGAAKVKRMILVDCGDAMMTPLTDLSVLGQYVERVRDRVPPEADLRIYAAETAQSGDSRPGLVVRDTRSEVFISAAADHLRRSMKMLNCGDGSEGVVDAGKLSRGQIARKLDAIVPSG